MSYPNTEELIEYSYQEVPSWIRRGHTRKPNMIVRGLYWIFDWFQDFGPMFGSLFRGMGKAGSKTWGATAKSVMLFINFALVVGIIYLSVGHSYSLLVYTGFSGIDAWVAVGVWEAVFVYCSIVIDRASQKGLKSSKAAWIGFFMGFGFVIVSNYMGMADNTIGKAVGIATPFLLLVMKKVLEYQFKPDADKQKKKSWFSSMKDWRPSFFKKKSSNVASNKVEVETSNKSENDLQLEGENNSKLEIAPTMETSDKVKESTTSLTVDHTSSAKVETSNTVEEEEISNSEESLKSNNLTNMQNASSNMENDLQLEEKEKMEVEEISNQSVSNNVETTSKLETSRTTRKTSNKVKRKPKLEANKSILKMKVENPTSPMEWAIYLHQRDGKLPGRPTLMEESGCSDWIARQTLKELKEKIS